MDTNRFGIILDAQIKRVQDVLVIKAAEYATEDRLANFKLAAHLQEESVPRAIAGMMVKHTVSVYQMVTSEKTFTLDQWDEKITDHINYLILLRAALTENESNPSDQRELPVAEKGNHLRQPVH